MWKAKDIMKAKPVLITVDMKLADVSRMFEAHGIEVAPVIDSANKIHGFLTSQVLVKTFLMSGSQEGKDRIAHFLEALLPVTCVESDDDVKVIMRKLLDSSSSMVIVSSPEKKLTGVIGYREIFQFFRQEKSKPTTLREEIEQLQAELKVARQESQAYKSKLERLQRVVDLSPYLFHVVDRDGNIILANRLLHQMLGYQDGELLNKTIHNIYPQSAHKMASQWLNEVEYRGYHEPTHSSMVSKGGELVRVQVLSSSLYSDEGEFLGMITISREPEMDDMIKSLKVILARSQPQRDS